MQKANDDSYADSVREYNDGRGGAFSDAMRFAELHLESEKEQIERVFLDGWCCVPNFDLTNEEYWERGSTYYKETFNNEESETTIAKNIDNQGL